MKNSDLISVIAPVYNVKPYLYECINSILEQKYKNFELLLIDDGSTDGSGDICDELAEKDNRIRVIHKENGGLSFARNTGVKAAKGSYVCFIDSDDVISEDYLKILYENAKLYDADVSQCRYVKFYSGKEFFPLLNNIPQKSNKEDLFERLTYTGTVDSISLTIACNKLIRREIAEKISFPEGKLHEDEFYVNYLMEKAERFAETPAELYFYRQRNDSIVGNDNRGDIRHFAVVEAFKKRKKLYKKKCSKEIYKKMKASYRGIVIYQLKNFLKGKIGK